MVTPAIVLAVALYSMARATGLVGTTTALVIAHTMLALPFVVLNVGVSLDGLDRRLLQAAAGLGAGDFHIFRTVTLPLIAPGVVGGAVFAFVTSFDEVVLSIFLAGPTVKTLPVRIWEEIRLAYTPVVAVGATVMLLLALRRGERESPAAAGNDRVSTVQFAGISKVVWSGPGPASDRSRHSAGEFLTLLGPSGSGKTTLLNICAGYLAPSAGRLVVGGRDITALPPRQRKMGMVFQNYALFPHMSVAENVAYGLTVRRLSRDEIARRVTEVLKMTQLEGYGERAIRELSGGQQQRGGARPRDGDPAGHPADGRAAGRAGSAIAQGGTVRDSPPASSEPAHDHLRHARPGRSARHVGSDRRDARRSHRAVGLRRGPLRAAGGHLRRALPG